MNKIQEIHLDTATNSKIHIVAHEIWNSICCLSLWPNIGTRFACAQPKHSCTRVNNKKKKLTYYIQQIV